MSALRALIRAYQILLAPLLPPACRFAPSCSEYAREALERHGALRGSLLAARRVLRCHPWNEGGHDPVPPARSGAALAAGGSSASPAGGALAPRADAAADRRSAAPDAASGLQPQPSHRPVHGAAGIANAARAIGARHAHRDVERDAPDLGPLALPDHGDGVR